MTIYGNGTFVTEGIVSVSGWLHTIIVWAE